MKLEKIEPPRSFIASQNGKSKCIKHCASINLLPEEQVTFFTEDGKESDFCRTEWGFYATPSINKRLESFNFKTALVANNQSQFFIMLVEKEKTELFLKFLKDFDEKLVCWLNNKSLQKIEQLFS